MHNFLSYVGLIILLISSTNFAKGDTLTIQQVEGRITKLKPYVEYLDWGIKDTTPEAYTPDLLNKQPQPYSPHPTDKVFSYRIQIKNNTGQHLSYYLRTLVIGHTKVFAIPEKGHVQQFEGGESLPLSRRSVPFGNYKTFFSVEIPVNQTLTLYVFHFNNISGHIRYFKKFPPYYPVLYQKDTYLNFHHKQRYIEFSMMAAMLALVLYNLIVFFKTKYKTYIYYVLNVFSFVLYYLFQSQIGFEFFWGEYPWFHLKGGIYPAALSAIFAILFFRSFVRLKDLLPFWYKLLQGISFLFILVIIGLAIFQITESDILGDIVANFNSISTLISTSTILIASVLAIRKGSKEAKFYLFTTFILIISVILYLQLGAISLFSKTLILIGYTSQSLLLSFGLANSINNLEEEVSRQKLAQIQLKQEQAKEKQELLERQKDKLKAEVMKRTSELLEANEELFTTVSQLNEANDQLAKQREYLEDSNRKITASIQYAQRIQKASLPSEEHFHNHLPNSFVFYQPRDIVSGDFYWLGKQENKTIVIAADSTGHGVPGAFMSLIGTKLLDHIILEKNITSPAEILKLLDHGVEKSLNSGTSLDSQMNDGMDIAICVIDHQNKKVTFSGAHNPMFIVHQNGTELIKGDKMPIGSSHHYEHKQFTEHEYNFSGGERIYLYSDGFVDQFGGDEARKYYPKRFRAFLEEIAFTPINEQKNLLQEEFQSWKRNYAQTDDLLVIGLEL